MHRHPIVVFGVVPLVVVALIVAGGIVWVGAAQGWFQQHTWMVQSARFVDTTKGPAIVVTMQDKHDSYEDGLGPVRVELRDAAARRRGRRRFGHRSCGVRT